MEVNPLPVQINPHLADMAARPAKSDSRANLLKRRVDTLPPDLSRIRSPQSVYLVLRTIADRLAALVLFVAAAPVISVSALLVKLTSRGPAFYTQTRIGLRGRLFTIYKIRTMIHNCESLTGPRWSMPGDPRVTRLGWFLRATHFDELPQLLNVLRGVTGLAQVQQTADTDLNSVRRKLAYDLYYIERLSPWLDLRLLFATA